MARCIACQIKSISVTKCFISFREQINKNFLVISGNIRKGPRFDLKKPYLIDVAHRDGGKVDVLQRSRRRVDSGDDGGLGELAGLLKDEKEGHHHAGEDHAGPEEAPLGLAAVDVLPAVEAGALAVLAERAVVALAVAVGGHFLLFSIVAVQG